MNLSQNRKTANQSFHRIWSASRPKSVNLPLRGAIQMIRSINHITLAVSDIEKSINFYRDILGLALVVKWKNGAYLNAGKTWFALNRDLAVLKSKRIDYSHIAFTCSCAEFRTLKAEILKFGTTEWSKNESEGDSFYFTDPDGHHLEIHVGNLESRLMDMRKKSWDNFGCD